MNLNKFKTIALFAVMATTVFSCKKKEDSVTPTVNSTGEIGFEFTNYAGNTELAMKTGTYQNANGDDFTVTKFNYYITNIRFKKSDGSYFAEPASYHLVVGDSAATRHFHIEDVPTGTYTEISLTIGVDSSRNTTGAQTGALDPINKMFWDWNTGYIMAKLEGTSPKSTNVDKTFQHHIGGFGKDGKPTTVRTITLNLSTKPIVLSKDKESSVEIKADVLKWFTPNNISIATVTNLMAPGATAKLIADNYAGMLSVTDVINE